MNEYDTHHLEIFVVIRFELILVEDTRFGLFAENQKCLPNISNTWWSDGQNNLNKQRDRHTEYQMLTLRIIENNANCKIPVKQQSHIHNDNSGR